MNRGIKVLQTSALPLGYGAIELLFYIMLLSCYSKGRLNENL